MMLEARALTFLWPPMLGLLIAVPVLVVFYLRLIARRKRTDLRFAGLAIAGEGADDTAGAQGATGAT